jgi:proline iminopeptidase
VKRFYILIIVFGVVFSTRAAAQDSSFYFTTSDSVRLYVHIAGNGDPCLFIHGGPGITSYIFEAVPAAKLIEQKVRMIYFDQRGCGRSSSPSDSDYSMKRMEKDIEELRTFLKINKWSVMAHSFGGIIMTAYARDYPNNVRSLVYVHCTLNILSALQSHISNGTKLLKEDGDNYTVDTTVSPFDQMMAVHAELAKKGIEYKIMFRSQREKNIEDSLIDAASDHFNWDFQHHVWKIQDYMIDYTPYTKNIICPVLIITGTKDYAVGPRSYTLWKFKNSRVVLYDGAHTSYQEEPEWFAEKVIAFLKN